MSFQPPPFPPVSNDTRSPQLVGWTLTVTILALACVVVRMYTRLKVSRSVGWDDYTTLAAMVCSFNDHFGLHALTLIQVVLLVTMSLIIVQVHYGVGRHLLRLSVENIVHAGLYYHIVELLYIPGSALIKISACLFLLRIMAHGTSRALRLAVYFLMAVILILSLATGFTIIFRCLPVSAGWDIRIHGKCFSYAQILRIGYAQGVAWSIVTDFACAGFPIIILRKLQVNRRLKLALWGIMGLGILSSICCVVKIIYLGDLAKGDFTCTLTLLEPGVDDHANGEIDNGVDVIIWGTLEQNIGIIACSVPALQPLFKQWIDSRSTNGTATPGARNNPVLPSWDDSTCLTSLSHSQSSHSTMNHGFSRGEEPMYPLEERPAKGIWGTNDAGCVYPEASYDRQRQIGHTKEFSLV